MSICDFPQGRLGNAIFRYLASSILSITFNLQKVYDTKENDYFLINDHFFSNWKNNLLCNNIINLPVCNNKYLLLGYYQHDDIYIKYKKEIIEYIKNHPEHLLITDGNKENINCFRYNSQSYKAIDLLIHDKQINKYDIVFHLRLEDFIEFSFVMNPKCLIKILENYKNDKICFVVNKIKTDLEEKYIKFFTDKYNIVIESNDTLTDFHIMKNAKILCCSCSTLSWAASFFSESVELVYFPNYNNPDRAIHETFKKPIENTILYEFNNCSKEELINILNS